MTIKPDSQIGSKIEIEGLLNRLEIWQQQVHQGQIKQRLGLKAAVTLDESLVKSLRQLGLMITIDDAEAVGEAIKAIKNWLDHAPVAHFTFPSPLSPTMQGQLIEWLHQHIGPDILAEFMVDGSIAAGFILRTRNLVFDFTANQVLWQQRRRLRELINGV